MKRDATFFHHFTPARGKIPMVFYRGEHAFGIPAMNRDFPWRFAP